MTAATTITAGLLTLTAPGSPSNKENNVKKDPFKKEQPSNKAMAQVISSMFCKQQEGNKGELKAKTDIEEKLAELLPKEVLYSLKSRRVFKKEFKKQEKSTTKNPDEDDEDEDAEDEDIEIDLEKSISNLLATYAMDVDLDSEEDDDDEEEEELKDAEKSMSTLYKASELDLDLDVTVDPEKSISHIYSEDVDVDLGDEVEDENKSTSSTNIRRRSHRSSVRRGRKSLAMNIDRRQRRHRHSDAPASSSSDPASPSGNSTTTSNSNKKTNGSRRRHTTVGRYGAKERSNVVLQQQLENAILNLLDEHLNEEEREREEEEAKKKEGRMLVDFPALQQYIQKESPSVSGGEIPKRSNSSRAFKKAAGKVGKSAVKAFAQPLTDVFAYHKKKTVLEGSTADLLAWDDDDDDDFKSHGAPTITVVQ